MNLGRKMSIVDKIDEWANYAGLRWTSRATPVILVGVVSLIVFQSAGGFSDPSQLTWSASLAGLFGFLTLSAWAFTCRAPKTPRGKVGIVIAIATEREAERKRLKTELLDHLVEYLEQRPSSLPFKVIDVPGYLVPEVTDTPSAMKMCTATRGKLLIWGAVRTRRRGQQETLVIRLEGQVVHRETPLPRSLALRNDMRATIPKQTEINLEDELTGFEATSQGLAAAAKYVVALAFAVSDEWTESKSLLYELENELAPPKQTSGKRSKPKRGDQIGRLKPMVGNRLIEICFADYIEQFRLWTSDRDNLTLLAKAEPKLEEYRNACIRYSKEESAYWISKAMLEVTLRQNLSAAENLLRRCQAVAITDPTWRLSLAFIAVLRNQLNAAITHYDTAFRLNVDMENIFNVEAYVHWWLKRNGGPPALYLLSAMLNISGKNDLEIARADIASFEAEYKDPISAAVNRRIVALKAKTELS